MADVTIPYSNCNQSIKDSWFVSSSTLVPTRNAKSLRLVFREDIIVKFWRDRDWCSKMADVTIPYSNCNQSEHGWQDMYDPLKPKYL